jgi:hypothetical protein
MRPLWISIAVGSVVFACSVRTEVIGAPGSTSDEAGADGGPLVPGADATTTTTRDAAATTLDASPAPVTRDAASDAPSAAPEDGSAADATSCPLLASSYDQTCAADTECVNVGEVLTCPATECSFCRIETISTRAAAQYMAVYSSLTAAIPTGAVSCGCPDEGRACCVRGTCQQCFPLRPVNPAP